MTSPTEVDHGALPPWRVADLPEPLPLSFGNILRTIGPGAILLAGAIGGGEWIIGPLMAVTYGPSILWVATAGIFLQTIFNLEGIRYTLYTGEPILTGVMRLWPGPWFWAPAYLLLATAQLATPALAAGCANVLFAAWFGREHGSADVAFVNGLGMGVIGLCVVILVSGKSIERVLERASWVMVAFIFAFLVFVNIRVVPTATWLSTLEGFLTVRPLPENVNVILLASFAATAGSGGIGNIAITNWFRDKGFAMGRHVGAIGGALAAEHQELKSVGVIFPISEMNLKRWNVWWTYARIDQQLLWAVGCFLGMYLNVNLAMAITPGDGSVTNANAGIFQAQYLAQVFGPWMWGLTLLNGFWILFSTHLGNTDVLVRTSCDILWAAAPRVRRWSSSRIYALLLLLLTAWALVAIHQGSVIDLFKVLAVVANPILALAAIQILRVNSRFLPPELHPPLWRQISLVIAAITYGGLTVVMLVKG